MIDPGKHPLLSGMADAAITEIPEEGEFPSLIGVGGNSETTSTVGVDKNVDMGRSGTRKDVIYNSPKASKTINIMAMIAEVR